MTSAWSYAGATSTTSAEIKFNPDKPLIRDLIIEGLSLARTQKVEFASVIEANNGDVTKLFDTLKEFISK